jgi:4-amino-4-deoxy-L-arabinose transferase-like glycosyltransferase
MKTAKLIIGIVSIVLTFLILFQSCAASIGEALIDEDGATGGVGVLVAILMLIAGIVAIAARNSKGGGIFCLVLYGLAGIIGITAKGIFEDLIIWGGLCLIFAVFFLISTIMHDKPKTAKASKLNETEGNTL